MINIANPELLAAAIVGYQHQLEDITAKIAEINSKLGKPVIEPLMPAGFVCPPPVKYIDWQWARGE